MKPATMIGIERQSFHKKLAKRLITIDRNGAPSIADGTNGASVRIAKSILNQIGGNNHNKRLAAQTAGNEFETICCEFLAATFLKLGHLRPGKWEIGRMSQGDRTGIAKFEQYAHLSSIAKACSQTPELATVLGTDYIISPDIVITRMPESDECINQPGPIVDGSGALLTGLRARNGGLALIHASISCKLTLRSDRAQNARSEALNLIRNRKGQTPHIVVVTAEPLPSRLASLALGTGDIDCVYHVALPELQNAVTELGNDDSREMLSIMTNGKRLRDVSDLVFDLAI